MCSGGGTGDVYEKLLFWRDVNVRRMDWTGVDWMLRLTRLRSTRTRTRIIRCERKLLI